MTSMHRTVKIYTRVIRAIHECIDLFLNVEEYKN
jgi:hypothetical protein